MVKLKSLLPAMGAFALFMGALFLSGVWAAHFFPPLLYVVERFFSRSLPYEAHMRMYVGGMVTLLLAGYGVFIAWKRLSRHKVVGIALGFAWVPLMLVFLLDTRHSLVEEMSWIRYPSALALIISGAVFFLIARRYNHGEAWPKKRELVYLILGAAMVFAGFDEVGEFHEKIGYVLEKLFSLAHITTDLVTVAYFVAGVTALLWMAPVIIDSSEERMNPVTAHGSPRCLALPHNTLLPPRVDTHSFWGNGMNFFLQTCFFGILLFGLATFFDTVDGVVFGLLKKWGASLASRGYSFSDAWYILYEPKRLLNGLEEVFEYFSAVLFASAGIWKLKSMSLSPTTIRSGIDDFFGPRFLRGTLRALKNRDPLAFCVASSERVHTVLVKDYLSFVVSSVVVAFLISPVFFPKKNSNSPLESGEAVVSVATAEDGLFHSDDLDFSAAFGIMLANESEPSRAGSVSGPGVFVFQEGIVKRLPDPDRKLRDIDSLSACPPGICISSAADGKVWYYEEGAGLRALADRSQGLVNPEGIAWREGTLAILDEGRKTVSRFDIRSKVLEEYRPSHRFWQAPEGIAYHHQLNAWLVSDDVTGVIFMYHFGEPLEVWHTTVPLKAPEDLFITKEGEVFVTDNGRGEVVVFYADGSMQRSLRFRPLFRDVQGVATNAEGEVFVVSADAYGSASFMPSYLWKIPLYADMHR
ncbi:MAG: hypothetical protein AB1352_03105 [Patescibacteria group bacterium]